MDVLGHEDVGGQAEALLFAGLFEDLLEGVFCFFGAEEGLALVTTEGDEVELLRLLEALQARWHGGASSLHPTLRRSAKDGAPGVLWVDRRFMGGFVVCWVVVGRLFIVCDGL